MAIQADLAPAVEALSNLLKRRQFRVKTDDPWWTMLRSAGEKNKQVIEVRNDRISNSAIDDQIFSRILASAIKIKVSSESKKISASHETFVSTVQTRTCEKS